MSAAPVPSATARLDLDRRADRARANVSLRRNRLLLRALAAGGDLVAQRLTRTGSDLTPLHDRLREAGPLVRSRSGVVALTSYALCSQALRDPCLGLRDQDDQVAGGDAVTAAAGGALATSFLELDPPDHTRLRRLAAPAFRPAAVRGWEPQVQHAVDDALARTAAVGHLDVMGQLASPLPIAVICDLLGIPAADRVRFVEIGRVVGQSLDGVRSLREADALRRALAELAALFTRLSDERRRAPGTDVLSLLSAAQDAGLLTADELVATSGLLLVAGFETTVNLIGNAVALLLDDRAEWERLVADPGRASLIVEETLRHSPPVQFTVRTAQADTELGGMPIERGTLVLVDLATASRDPELFDDPDRFRPDRHLPRAGEHTPEHRTPGHCTSERRTPEHRTPEHLAFSSGIHYCLGAPLAQLEGAVALATLARTHPGLARRPGARRRRGTIIRGWRTLPVTSRPPA